MPAACRSKLIYSVMLRTRAEIMPLQQDQAPCVDEGALIRMGLIHKAEIQIGGDLMSRLRRGKGKSWPGKGAVWGRCFRITLNVR